MLNLIYKLLYAGRNKWPPMLHIEVNLLFFFLSVSITSFHAIVQQVIKLVTIVNEQVETTLRDVMQLLQLGSYFQLGSTSALFLCVCVSKYF